MEKIEIGKTETFILTKKGSLFYQFENVFLMYDY
jgi:hypothetical protein